MAAPESSQHYTAVEWSAYVDGESLPAQRATMSAHLETCAECAALARSFAAVQRGAEELARQAEPPPAHWRSRLLAVGVSVAGRRWAKYRWLILITVLSVIAVMVGLTWHLLTNASKFKTSSSASAGSLTPASAKPVAAATAGKSTVTVTIDNLLITHLLIYPPSLDYELTIRNVSAQPIVINGVFVSDPLGEVQRPVQPLLEIKPGEKIQWTFGRLVEEKSQLLPGRYRLWLLTEKGSFAAERTMAAPKNP